MDGVELRVLIFVRLTIRRRPMRTLAMGYKRLPFETRGIRDSGLVSDCVTAVHVMLVVGALSEKSRLLYPRADFVFRRH